MDKKKIPNIRFKGFIEPWEQRKLGDIYTFKYGEFNNNPDNSGKYPIYGANGIIGGYTDWNAENSSVIGHMGAYAGTVLWGEGKHFVTYNGTIAKPIDDSLDSKFGYYLLYAKNINRICAGSGLPFLSYEQLKKMDVIYPNNIIEQKKIRDFFTKIDDFITLHQRKLEYFKKVKEGLLQKMFPKNEEKVPNIRFKGFNEPWEQRKLGEIGTTFSGLSGKTKDDFGHGDAKFITYMNVFSNPITILSGVESIEVDNKQSTVKYGDILFTASSETPDEVGMSSVWLGNSENTYLNSFCFGFRPIEKFNPYYLAYMLRSPIIRNNFKLLAQGISRYNISKNKVMDMEVFIPSIEEQKQIGNFFHKLDNLISLHQRKLEKLQNIKKSCLEKMFV